MIQRLKQKYAGDNGNTQINCHTALANIEISENYRQKIWSRIPFFREQGEPNV